MKRLNEREKQTILGLFTVFIIIILLASAFIGLFMSRNSASDAKDIKKAYESLSEVKRKPTNATNDGGLLVQVGSKKDIPTVEFYLDPLCPACAQIDRTLNDDIGKMYTSGQIKLEIHPVIFLDKCSSDHYSARVSGSIAYISEKDPKHVVAFISEIFDEKFQPSEVDYVEMSDEKIIEQAIKAGISREIAKESLNGQYDEWIEKSNDYTILRSDLIAPGREGFATPLIRVNKRIWSMKDMALDDLSDAFVESLNKSSDRFLAKEVPLYCPSNTAVMTSRSVDFPASLSPTTILIPGESSTCSLENLLNPNTRISFIYIAYPPDCLINYPLVYMDW